MGKRAGKPRGNKFIEPDAWIQEPHYTVYVALPSWYVRGEAIVILRKSTYNRLRLASKNRGNGK